MTLPASWSEVTISQYYKLNSICNVYKNPIERQIKILSFFLQKEEKEIEKMKMSEIIGESKKLGFLSELPKEDTLSVIFELKENTYKAILISEDMQAGQFIDFSHCGKGCSAEEITYHMHELIACMCLTKKENAWMYEGFIKTADDFLEMPMAMAYPYYVFFCKVLMNLQKPIQEFSQNLIKTNLRKMEKMLQST